MKRILGQIICFAIVSVLLALHTIPTYADGNNTLRYELGRAVNTGKDNGYSGNNEFKMSDPHYGWTLGHFAISGYTRAINTESDTPMFIKTLDDKVALWFTLEQDIDKLNGDEKLVVSEDTNGYDKYFQTQKTNRGRGSLIVKKIDYQNSKQTPVEYNNYLKSKTVGAETEVELFEEGDYEVALDYEISERKVNIFAWEPIHAYTNYRIFFKFSVRNGNCMVYPFDINTKAELSNSSITESGFYLDLAKSRYLDINVKKSVLAEGTDGLTGDTRFNRPAKDGDEYTEEGVYTIEVKNRYTGENTTKQIYVGTNNILKAYITTGISIREINEQIALGAEIKDDGSIIPPPELTPMPTPKPIPTSSPNPSQSPNPTETAFPELSDNVEQTTSLIFLTVIGIIVATATKIISLSSGHI
jgi:hypothetical protein